MDIKAAITKAIPAPSIDLGVSANSNLPLMPAIRRIARLYPRPTKNPCVSEYPKLPCTALPSLKNISEFKIATPKTAQFVVIRAR